ncbi:MAG TPA: phage Gp37/Gp68 family protein [Elusimicrobiales bacterium]|nr:phage Gp37/Gp68 family protein [Elusimicrobiales bacterium]
MANNSSIEWTESTWNPVTGCTKISPGCANCYAERMAKRLQAMGQSNYKHGFDKVCTHKHALKMPLVWKKPQMIFVNSMSDLFHKDVPTAYIKKVFAVMKSAKQHNFQILTKRADRLLKLSNTLSWENNIWMGVTVENKDYINRIDYLKKTNAKIKFVSFEPLLDKIGKVNLKGIDWAIVGGESGPNSRFISPDWVLEIKQQCKKYDVPFFFKQWGGVNKKKTGRLLNNKTYDAMPRLALSA